MRSLAKLLDEAREREGWEAPAYEHDEDSDRGDR